MNIEKKQEVMEWGALDVQLFGVNKTWNSNNLDTPIAFSMAIDPLYFWFIVTHSAAAYADPESDHGSFKAGLWQYDVAEFFIYNKTSKHYLEFNLASNAAWWAADFSAPREQTMELPNIGVETYSDIAASGTWMAAAKLDLAFLKEQYNFGNNAMMNAAFIIGSPKQEFISVVDLPGESPDFHQPNHFKKVNFFDAKMLKA